MVKREKVKKVKYGNALQRRFESQLAIFVRMYGSRENIPRIIWMGMLDTLPSSIRPQYE